MGNAKPVTITVHIEDDSTIYPPDPPYKFWLDPNYSKVGKKKTQNLTFNNENTFDGFDLTFVIDDDTKKDFKFMDIGTLANGDPDPDVAPMWVKTVPNLGGQDCPDREFWDQFKAVKVYGNNKKLDVRNENKDKQCFKFALRFSTTKGPVMYDPGGTNLNGTHPIFNITPLVVAAIGGAIVGSLITLGVEAAISG
ncbi:MAG TPA: hypothetical protein VGM04_07230 [Sphingomicrobium sp.]|jgi:hypothetical protein